MCCLPSGSEHGHDSLGHFDRHHVDRRVDVVPTTGPSCQPGEVVCQGNSALSCDDSGHLGVPETCIFGCDEALGCISCPPGQLACSGDALTQCSDDGEFGDIVVVCDPVQGLTCDAGAGACTGACASDPARPSELGCEFWAVSLPSRVFNLGGYGVGITTTCDVPTNLSIEVAGSKVAGDTLAPSTSAFVELPRPDALIALYDSAIIADVSYWIRTDCPVGMVQISSGPGTASADASRLYPTDRWGRDAVVASSDTTEFQFQVAAPSYLAVTPRDDATAVTITAPPGMIVDPVDGITPDGNGAVTLDRGELLILTAAIKSDISGAIVTADRPIQVFGAHECARVPLGFVDCDHLEEVMPPLGALGDDYIVVPPTAIDLSGMRVDTTVRVFAIEDGTTVMVVGAMEPSLLDRGEFVEHESVPVPMRIQASAPVLVAQYHVGHGDNNDASDPSLLVPAPIAQYRLSTTFWTAPDWPLTFVEIVAPSGTEVMLDGMPVTNFLSLSVDFAFDAATVLLDVPGRHVVTANQPVGVNVYAYSDPLIPSSYAYTSGWHWPAP